MFTSLKAASGRTNDTSDKPKEMSYPDRNKFYDSIADDYAEKNGIEFYEFKDNFFMYHEFDEETKVTKQHIVDLNSCEEIKVNEITSYPTKEISMFALRLEFCKNNRTYFSFKQLAVIEAGFKANIPYQQYAKDTIPHENMELCKKFLEEGYDLKGIKIIGLSKDELEYELKMRKVGWADDNGRL